MRRPVTTSGSCADVAALDADTAAVRPQQPHERLGERFGAAAGGADDGDLLAGLDIERDVLEEPRAAVVAGGEIAEWRCGASIGATRLAASACTCGIDELVDMELLDDLGVLDLHIEALLVPVDQVLDRASAGPCRRRSPRPAGRCRGWPLSAR